MHDQREEPTWQHVNADGEPTDVLLDVVAELLVAIHEAEQRNETNDAMDSDSGR